MPHNRQLVPFASAALSLNSKTYLVPLGGELPGMENEARYQSPAITVEMMGSLTISASKSDFFSEFTTIGVDAEIPPV